MDTLLSGGSVAEPPVSNLLQFVQVSMVEMRMCLLEFIRLSDPSLAEEIDRLFDQILQDPGFAEKILQMERMPNGNVLTNPERPDVSTTN